MNTINKVAGALLIAVGAAGLSGCATGLPTQVSRYQAMPAPAGQTFYIVPAEGGTPGLEFGRFSSIVAQQLQARGYAPAGAPQLASMIVKLDYGVDEGTREYSVDPFARSRYGYGPYGRYYDPFGGTYYGRPYWSRYGYWGSRSPFYYGWDDPFWYYSPYAGYGPGFRDPIRSYTVYKSHLDMQIVRREACARADTIWPCHDQSPVGSAVVSRCAFADGPIGPGFRTALGTRRTADLSCKKHSFAAFRSCPPRGTP